MAWNSFLSNFLTIVFTLFEGKNTHLKVIKQPKAMCLVQRGGRRGEGVSSCFPKGVAGRGWDTRVPQVKTILGRVLSRQSRDLLVVAVGHLQWPLGTRTVPKPTPQCAPPNSCTPRCSAKPLHPRAVVIGVCHQAWPFHTKHPVGKTHNFYTTQSRWSRRPFEVLFVGHLQAFLITGSLRGASLWPGFCLAVLGGEGVSLGSHSAWRAPCQALCWGSLGKVGSRPGTLCHGQPGYLGILTALGHPLQEHPPVISHDLEALADFVSLHFRWDIEWELKENPFTKKALFPTCLYSPSHGRLLG